MPWGHGERAEEAMVVRKRSRYGAVMALVSGAALVFCFPRFDISLLAYVALVPLLVSIWGESKPRAFLFGFLMGLPYFIGTNYWIYHSGYHYGGLSLMASAASVALLGIYLSLYTGAFAVLYSDKISSTSLPASLLAPVFWVLMEYLRTHALTGFPYSIIGYTQHSMLRTIQSADLFGVYATSFIVVAVNGAIADIFIMRSRRDHMPLFNLTPTLAALLLVVVCVLANLVYGGQRLDDSAKGNLITATVVQGNIDQSIKWSPDHRQNTIDIYTSLSNAASESSLPDLVVWPESAIPSVYGAEKESTDRINSLVAEDIGAPLLMGAVTESKGENQGYYANSAVLINAAGRHTYTYSKIHLVPFGEYVPMKSALFFIDRMVEGIGDYRPGKTYNRGTIEGKGSFATLICYEIVFPDLVRRFYKDGGDFMVTVTNDAWFGNTAGPYQNFAMSVFRAVENRKPLIRAANTGISGFIDSHGRVLAQTNMNERRSLTAEIITDPSGTLYSRLGDMLPYFCIILTLVLIVDTRRK